MFLTQKSELVWWSLQGSCVHVGGVACGPGPGNWEGQKTVRWGR